MTENTAQTRLPSLATITLTFVVISASLGLGMAYVLISERASAF